MTVSTDTLGEGSLVEKRDLLRYDVVIVGAGPAGASAGLQLAARSPELAARTVILDGAMFPRQKLCGGGVVALADELLGWLDVRIDVPAVSIDVIQVLHPGGEVLERRAGMFRVVRRETFDHALVCEVRAKGVAVHEGKRVVHATREGEAVRLRTTGGEYLARVVIGADGARSVVRKRLVGPRAGHGSVALELLTREDPDTAPAFRDRMAQFDFRDVADGLRGYSWCFPSLKEGSAFMNRGLGGGAGPGIRNLQRRFVERLSALNVPFSATAIAGAAVPLYHPASAQSAERVVLAGDAVGADPISGEGISVAIGTGMLAAHAVADAFASQDFTFATYGTRIARSSVGSILTRNWLGAGSFYARLRRRGPVRFTSIGLQ